MSLPIATSSGLLGLGGFGRREQVAERDELALMVGHLDADRRSTGDRGEDAHVDRRHCVGDVLLQAGDPGDLDAGAEFEFVSGDRRADRHAEQRRFDTVRCERLVQHSATCLDRLAIDRLLSGPFEERHRRQHPLADWAPSPTAAAGRLAAGVDLGLARPSLLRWRQLAAAEVVALGSEVVEAGRQRRRLAGDVDPRNRPGCGVGLTVAVQRRDVADPRLRGATERGAHRSEETTGLLSEGLDRGARHQQGAGHERQDEQHRGAGRSSIASSGAPMNAPIQPPASET